MKNITVLGAGLVGKTMILDLYKSHNITVADIDKNNLTQFAGLPNVEIVETDLLVETNIRKVITSADLVIGSVPGFMGYNMVKSVIEAGKNIVDISFFPENPLELDGLAKDNDVTAIVDCGVVPGMANIILGHYLTRMTVNSYKCLVGGLPIKPDKPWGYKAVFSPIDVIEEYTRPARIRKNGQYVVEEPLSKKEIVEFEQIGKFEAWNTDGLRTLLDTTDIPNMVELTIRHTDSIEPIIALRDSGFFSYDEVTIGSKKVRPIDLTTKLIFDQWKLHPGEHDMTVLRIFIEGDKNGVEQNVQYDLIDYYDIKTDTTSMARTTGYTCTAAVNLFLEGRYNNKGIIPPEILGQDVTAFNYILNYLAERGVVYKKVESEL